MHAVEKYLSKFPEYLIAHKPNPNLGFVVTIPAFNEPETIKSIDSLLNCDLPQSNIEILVNVNFSESATDSEKKFNLKAFQILNKYAKEKSTEKIKIHILYFPNQNKRVAGVGWARKQIMDEAFRRLLSVSNESGIITGFDADSKCHKNYFTELEKFFENQPKATGCSIRFKHPISGSKYPQKIYNAITLYELHLRYFINAQKQIGLPFAFQTVGSSFAVRARNYAQVNGMSPKKAGEDFYFLQKIIALGEFYNLYSTCVYPSPRISSRVGFGTGPSVDKISRTGTKLTYNYKSFLEIKKLYDALLPIYNQTTTIKELKLADSFSNYLQQQKIDTVVQNLIKNNKSFERFKSAFTQWFGAFQVLKVLNILSDSKDFENENIIFSIHRLGVVQKDTNPKSLLKAIRIFDTRS